MYCKKCGNKLLEGAKFCNGCGHRAIDNSVYPVVDLNIKNKEANKYKKNPLLIVISIVVGALILIIIIDTFSDSSDPQQQLDDSNLKSTANATKISDSDFEKVSEAVVNIICPYSSEPFLISSNGTGGSGTIIDSSGLVISNSHIIPQDKKALDVSEEGCFVVLPDIETGAPKEIYLATPLVFNDLSDEYDLAFLIIYDVYSDQNQKYGQYPNDFPSFDDTNFCEDDKIRLGESVRILGYPVSSGGYNLTITDGIVSSFTDEGLILTSAKIDQGNSGGLAIDKDGCMIGVPSAVSEGQYDKLGVIIPPSVLVDFINEVDNKIN